MKYLPRRIKKKSNKQNNYIFRSLKEVKNIGKKNRPKNECVES